ncbi:MAG TPA: protein kinase [Candidatus Kryptonia bacterium]
MSELTGTTILHYEILEKLGEGGMGEVYKAHDTKLDRLVALKFLPSSFTAAEADKMRFTQEAKAASALNHPNVCTIYDIQEHEGQLFIVMEYVDGQTLRNRNQNFSVRQVVDIGAQAAEGLAAAHEKGIVHRDIKPENIMLTKNGIAKVMDFGLAKLNNPADVSRLTKAGTTLGTIGYMSPEQVQGQDVDHRSDIFSLGVVLYELLSGESPFKGVHETAIMYEIVNVDPEPVSARKEGIDPELDRIIFECLEKEKDDRYQSARELSKDLRRFRRDTGRQRVSRMSTVHEPLNTASDARSAKEIRVDASSMYIDSPPRESFSRRFIYNPRILWAGSGLLMVALVLSVLLPVFKSGDNHDQEIKATVLPPPGVSLLNSQGSNLAISPNGKYITFVGSDSLGTIKLWLRPTNSLASRALVDVSVEAYPFWSSDSKYIAYFDSHKLMKVSLDAGTSLPICDAPAGRGGSWNKDGMIVFAPNSSGGLSEVASSGGEPNLLVKTDTSTLSLRWPFFLPDGKHFLYSSQNSQSGSSPTDGIFVASLGDARGQKIIRASSNVQYADGYIFYLRQSILLAEKFDPGNMNLSGEGIPVAENMQYWDIRISGTFSVSEQGTLVYEESNPDNEKVVLLDKNGNITRNLFNKKIFLSACFSPDGHKIAFDSYDQIDRNLDIWTYDIERNVMTRLTFEQAGHINPIWTPDGKQIAYSSNPEKLSFNPYIKNSDGSRDAVQFHKSDDPEFVYSFSADMKYALLGDVGFAGKNSGWDLLVLSLTGTKTPVKFLATDFNERAAQFSPNMKWVAYVSDESGRNQVYIVPFGNGNGKWQVSVDGGDFPLWMENGKKIYFQTYDDKIEAVDVNESGSSISPGRPYVVFGSQGTVTRIFSIDKSGNEILAAVPNNKSMPSPITLVSNWKEEIQGR